MKSCSSDSTIRNECFSESYLYREGQKSSVLLANDGSTWWMWCEEQDYCWNCCQNVLFCWAVPTLTSVTGLWRGEREVGAGETAELGRGDVPLPSVSALVRSITVTLIACSR